MRSAGRLSRLLVVLGILSLVLPETGAFASGRGPSPQKAKAKTAAAAKKSKDKMAVGRSKMKTGKEGKKGNAKAAGFLPRPGAGKATGAGGGETGRGMLASAISGQRTASATPSTSRARTTSKARRQTRVTKKTRRPTAKKRRAARTQRNRARRSGQSLETAGAEMAAAEGMEGAEREMGAMDLGQGPTKQPSRFRRIMSGAGKVLRKTGKAIIYTSVVVAPMVVMAAGGLPIAFAIGAPAIFLGIPMVIGIIERRAQQAAGTDDPQQEMLQRYMSRQMLENQELNGPGPGNGVAGVGGLNTLGNMINPGGIGGRQLP